MLSEEVKSQIADAVKRAELQTSLEFVPVYKTRSSSYRGYRLSLAIVTGAIVSWVVFFSLSYFSWSAIGAREGLVSIGAGVLSAGALYLVVGLAYILRLVLPNALKHGVVESEAEKSFLYNEVFQTKGRTGVLIYVSELEESVFVVADKGLLAHFPASVWQSLGSALASDFGFKGRAFIPAITQILDKAVGVFPGDKNDRNELCDQVRDN